MRALWISPGRSGLFDSRSNAGFCFCGHGTALAGGGFSGHGLNLRVERNPAAGRSAVSSRPGDLTGLGNPSQIFWDNLSLGVGVGEAIIPKTSINGLGIGERESTPATPTFVKERNPFGAKNRGIIDCPEQPIENLGQLGGGINLATEFCLHGILENCASKDHALLFVSQQGDVDKENGEANLAVVFVPSLLHLDGDVLVRVRVEEGEDRTTCEEKAWEGEGIDVGTYHRWLVYGVKIRHILEDKKLNPGFFGNYFFGLGPLEDSRPFDLIILFQLAWGFSGLDPARPGWAGHGWA